MYTDVGNKFMYVFTFIFFALWCFAQMDNMDAVLNKNNSIITYQIHITEQMTVFKDRFFRLKVKKTHQW